jgi:predicted kinase
VERRAAVYTEISRRLPAALQERGLVIVDGTFGRRDQRAELARAAAAAGASLWFLHCHCPLDMAGARVHERAHREPTDSEIRPEMLTRQAAEAEPFLAEEKVVRLDTSEAPGMVVRNAVELLRKNLAVV